ncbi:hypothetical protein OMD46_16330 [Pseudomonas sp. MDMC_285]|nr:hypothetical protein [Pseudomonas sp. MDMC_285]
MTMIVNPFTFGSVTPSVNRMVFPLTYDERDSDNAITLTRAGSGPHITPAGFEGDGYSSRYTYASVPGWVSSSSRLTLACAVTAPLAPLQSARDELVSVCENNTNARQLLGLSVVADPRSAPEGAIAVRAWNGTQLEQIIGRPGWRYEFRSPVLSAGGYTAKPQAVLFLDADTVAFSVHLDDTESRVYKVRLSDGELLGEFTFGTSTYRHIANFARRSNGDVWASDYDTNKLVRLDLDASFSSGNAVILDVYDTSTLAPYVGSIEFVTVSGTEYLLLALYNTTEAGTHTYVINASLLGTATFTLGDQFKRFDLGRRIQGIAMRSGKMIIARNALYGVSGAVNGYIQEVDIVTAITSLTTNSTINATTNSSYLTGQWFGPSSYVEDVATPSN